MPRREEFLPFALPSIGEEEIGEVVDTLRSGWLTTGPKTHRFEREFAQFVGARHALAVNSATAGLHLALDAIGLGPDDIVLTSPLTFTATAEVVRYFGARPMFVDIEPDTMNLDPAKLAAALGALSKGERERVRAVIPVHFGGQACEMGDIMQLAEAEGLRVIEDAAHSLPARVDGRMVGSIGDLTVFSFYVTKTITTGEGGMVTTDSDAYAKRIQVMRLHGINRDAWNRYGEGGAWYYEVVAPGFKYNMPDLAAAIGIHQLAKAEAFRAARQVIAERYEAAFADLPEVETPVTRPGRLHAWHLYVIRLELDRLTLGRGEFIEALRERKIGSSVHFIPLHLQPYYRDTYTYCRGDFPEAERAYDRAVSLPIYPKMTEQDTQDVTDAVREIVEAHRR
jgi:dTDP-4-amino-4,6-dideoxygalactose transaminase